MAKEHIKPDLKAVLSTIKSRYSSKRSSFEWFVKNAARLNVLNIDERSLKLDLRGEKTPSTVVGEYLTYCDFGDDGRKHDVIFLIQRIYGDNFPEAVKRLADWENEPLDEATSFKPLVHKEIKKRPPYSNYFLKVKKEESFKDSGTFKKLIEGLCRNCSIEEMRRAVKLFDIGLDTYINKEGKVQKRLFIPEFNQDKIAFGSFRYNRELSPKGLIRKDSKRVLFGSHLLGKFNPAKPIVFTEGHSDCIVNNAKGIASVTSGSATTKIGKEALNLLKGKELHFYPDADEAGIKGVCSKIIEIEAFNASVSENEQIKYKVFFWAKSFIHGKERTKLPKKKKGDLITYNDFIKLQIILFKEAKFHAPEEAKVSNWTFFNKKIAKEGYDFIDFHGEFKDNKRYRNLVEHYSFF